jgi:molecular chaperone HtpG
MQEKGTISIHTENIFPIIKKFLYSDHEIFLRELVSNAVDATQKVKRLATVGELSGEQGELKVKVAVDKEAKTITISDRGIGMTAEEMKKYINQIAFSGATEFVEKYKDKGGEEQIIGMFGLGFYSAFMVAKEVEIVSLSHQEGAKAARWRSEGTTEFEISPAEKEDRGTDVILHVAEDSEEFLEAGRLRQILDKYCKFLPVEVEFEGQVINNPRPLWTKQPSELTDEDYLNFYRELYPFSEDPLFWIHLNVDHPFNLTGVLYFPRIKPDFELQKNKIQLYSKQVFITDEVKDVVPEFLMLLHGVLDSPDIPLNVSRSFLQADSNVKKINQHITKKVADKLNSLFKNDREGFTQKWNDIGVFVKYGMLSDEKFYDRAKDFVLLKSTDGKHNTLEEYQNLISANQTDKEGNKVFLYTSDPARQDSFIQAATAKGYDVLDFSTVIDTHFTGLLERKLEKASVKRVDADTPDKLISSDNNLESVLSEKEKESLKEIFTTAIGNENMKVEIEAMSPEEQPVVITQPEFMRRMRDMARYGGGGMQFMGNMPETYNVSINANHAISQRILKARKENREKLAKQAYDLALLSQNLLQGADLTAFVKRSVELIAKE